jgi:hypothetical protein
VDERLIFWRALHFTATVQMTGVLLFCAHILHSQKLSCLVERHLRMIFWISLALAFASWSSLPLSMMLRG